MVLQVSAVTAVGVAEGTSHVNWRMLARILLWWITGFVIVLLATSVLVAQGHCLGQMRGGVCAYLLA